MDTIENNQQLSWYPKILPEIIGEEPLKYSPPLDAIQYDKKAEEIMPSILNRFKIGKEPHSPVELGKILDEMGASHLYENVYKILTEKYHRRFNRLQRQRSRGRKK